MKFFARVRPEGDVLPIRAEYNDDGVTKNIGINYLTSTEPVWGRARPRFNCGEIVIWEISDR